MHRYSLLNNHTPTPNFTNDNRNPCMQVKNDSYIYIINIKFLLIIIEKSMGKTI